MIASDRLILFTDKTAFTYDENLKDVGACEYKEEPIYCINASFCLNNSYLMAYKEIAEEISEQNAILMKHDYAHLYRSEESNSDGAMTRLIRKKFDLKEQIFADESSEKESMHLKNEVDLKEHTFICDSREKESMLLKNEVVITLYEYEAN